MVAHFRCMGWIGGGSGLTAPPQRLGRRPFATPMATLCQPGTVVNSKVPKLIDKWALKYDDEVKEQMVNPWADYVEVGDARFNPCDEPFTHDLPYGGRSLIEDKFEAPSAHPTMVNYSNHNRGSHRHRPHYGLTDYEDFYGQGGTI